MRRHDAHRGMSGMEGVRQGMLVVCNGTRGQAGSVMVVLLLQKKKARRWW